MYSHSNAFWEEWICWETCTNANVTFGDCCFLGTTGSFHGWSMEWEVMAGRRWGWQGLWELFLWFWEAVLELYAWSDWALERSCLVMVGRWKSRQDKNAVRRHCYSGAQPKDGQHSENRWLVLQPLCHLYQYCSNLKVAASHLVTLLICRFWFGGPWWGISSVQLLSCIRLFATPGIAACRASLSITNSWTLLKLMSIELIMLSNYLILCGPLLLLPSIFPSTGVCSSESVLQIRWPKYWSFSFSISPSNEHLGLISFRID